MSHLPSSVKQLIAKWGGSKFLRTTTSQPIASDSSPSTPSKGAKENASLSISTVDTNSAVAAANNTSAPIRSGISEASNVESDTMGNDMLVLHKSPLKIETEYHFDVKWLIEQMGNNDDFVKALTIDRANDVVSSMDHSKSNYDLCGKVSDSLRHERLHDLEEVFLRKRKDIAPSIDAGNKSNMVHDRNKLARCLFVQKKFDEAGKWYSEIVNMYKDDVNKNEDHIAHALMNLAICFHEQKKHEEAEKMYRDSMRMHQMQPGVNSKTNLLFIIHNLATTIHEQGKLDEAEQMYRKAIDIIDAEMDNKRTSTLRSSVGGMNAIDEDIVAANDDEEDLFNLIQGSKGLTKNNLGSLMNSKGKFEEAENLFRESIELLGHDHNDVAHAVNNLSNILQTQKKMEFNQVGGAHGNIVCSMGVISKKEDNEQTFEVEAQFYERISNNPGDPIYQITPTLIRVVRDSKPRLLMIEDITQEVVSIEAASTSIDNNKHRSTKASTFNLIDNSGKSLPRPTQTSLRQSKTLASNQVIDLTIPASPTSESVKRFVYKSPEMSSKSPDAELSPSKVGEADCCIMDCKLGYRSFRDDAPNIPEDHYFTKYKAVEKEIGEAKAMDIWKSIPRKQSEPSAPQCLTDHKLGKHDYLSFRDATTTSLKHGFRLTALRNSDYTVSQDESRSVSNLDEFESILKKFLVPRNSDITEEDRNRRVMKLAQEYIKKLRTILDVMKSSSHQSMVFEYDFIGTSLLFVHQSDRASVKWIDFANVTKPSSPDRNGIIEGIEALISCFEKLL